MRIDLEADRTGSGECDLTVTTGCNQGPHLQDKEFLEAVRQSY
jgi:hypothetical protein